MKIPKALKYLAIIIVVFVLITWLISYLIANFFVWLGDVPIVGDVYNAWSGFTDWWNSWLTANLGIVNPGNSSVADWIGTWWDQSMQWWSTTIANTDLTNTGYQTPQNTFLEGLNAIAIWWNSLWNP